MRVLLVTPPLVQPNTPYSATPVLAGFLESHGFKPDQFDASLELLLRLFSRDGLRRMRDALTRSRFRRPPSVQRFLADYDRYERTVEPAIQFLQGREPSLAHRIVSRRFLPEGPRFAAVDEMIREGVWDWQFGHLGIQDQARYLASLFVDDLGDVVAEGIDPNFQLSRYAEKLGASAPFFTPIRKTLESKPTLVGRLLDAITRDMLRAYRPQLVAITVPFPGNLYGALRIGRAIKAISPRTAVAIGGGYVNTELRQLSDPAVFDYVDYILLDDGEPPLLTLAEHLQGKRSAGELVRTFVREKGKVVFKAGRGADVPHCRTGMPSYRGLALDRYISLCEMPNPMHRLWSDGRWNKMMLAHGCYWRKCAFCDVSLDYIRRFDPAPAAILVDRIEAVIRQTGQTGFHFTDEAAPPALLRALAEEVIRRGLTITWWCNIRFEKSFTPELARRLAESGCIAVTGGLEGAHDRLLKLMRKGVTLRQAARATKAFADAGIMVHAYLIYGFPTQTIQETIDALEAVRRLFAAGWIQSAYWHRFALTVHSPVARDPKSFGIRLLPPPKATFAVNELPFEDRTGIDHGKLGPGLRKAVYNLMLGLGLEEDVRSWFDFKVPAAKMRRII